MYKGQHLFGHRTRTALLLGWARDTDCQTVLATTRGCLCVHKKTDGRAWLGSLALKEHSGRHVFDIAGVR
jgi:hypothetical protein